MRTALTVAIGAALTLLCRRPATADPAGPDSPYPLDRFQSSPWFQNHDWLLNVSSYSQTYDWENNKPGRTRLGVAGVGSGRVFGLIGLRDTLNAILSPMGPSYEMSDEDNNLPDIAYGLFQNGRRASLPRQTLLKTRRTGFAITGETNGTLDLQTVTFGLPGSVYFFRALIVRNTGVKPMEGLQLKLLDDDGFSLDESTPESDVWSLHKSRRGIWAQVAPPGTVAFSLAGGEEKTFYARMTVLGEGDQPRFGPLDEAAFEAAMRETRAFWGEWFEGTMKLTASDPRLGDLMDDVAALVRMQHAEEGAVGTLPHYSGTWVRDGVGAVLAYLDMGKSDEARRHLDYMFRASKLQGLTNRYSLNWDVSTAPKDFDWNSLSPQQGDDPNILALQCIWFFDWTGDVRSMTDWYPMIRRNLLDQRRDGLYYPFHRDETFQVFFTNTESDHLERYYSADTTFMAYAAAKRMAEIARTLGKTEDVPAFEAMRDDAKKALTELYLDRKDAWYVPYFRMSDLKPADGPFANINLRPLWLGLDDSDLPALGSNLANAYKSLGRKSGLMKTSKRSGFITGNVPGYLLVNLAEIGHPHAARTLKRTIDPEFAPMAQYAESYDPNERQVMIFDVPTLYRAWESGINADAVLRYLTGLKFKHFGASVTLTPSLWADDAGYDIRNLRAGGFKFDLSVSQKFYGDAREIRREYRLTNVSSREAEILLRVRVPGKITVVEGEIRLAPDRLNQRDALGNYLAEIPFVLKPGRSFDAAVTYAKQ